MTIRQWIGLCLLLCSPHLGSSAMRGNGTKVDIDELEGFIAAQMRAQLAGIRIESVDTGKERGFIDYDEDGISIVRPDTPVRVVLFGWELDEVVMVGFTATKNCGNTLRNHTHFITQTETRLVVQQTFPDLGTDDIFKICMKMRPRESKNGETVESPFALIDSEETSISAAAPPRKYHFPLPIQIAILAVLLVFSGLFAGLTLGLMGLTPQELMLISKSGSKREKKYAETILPVRKQGNFLLCSLVLGNVMVNSSISILFDDLTSGTVALVLSTVGIVVFGEIFPQSVCVKKGLAVGARTIWITRLIMAVTLPIAWPVSKFLDYVLGDEMATYDRRRLIELIKLSTRNEDGLAEELKIAVGAMELSDKTVADVMTRIDDVFMLPDTTVLNTKTVTEILRMGYTRIPIYSSERNNVVSLLFVKDLALLDPDDNFTVKTVCRYHVHALRFIAVGTPLRVMLEEFKKGDYHLAFVHKTLNGDGKKELVGIVTLEDIVEEILQAEIVDETDAITDNVRKTRRKRIQVDPHEFAHSPLDNDLNICNVSMHMQLVTMQWLVTNHPLFQSDHISKAILEKAIRQNVHKVELSHLPDMNDPNMIYPRTSKLYTKNKPSDKFILILEGRATVTIGKNEMTFEAGAWHCFGKELLDQLSQLLQQHRLNGTAPAENSHNTLDAVPSSASTMSQLFENEGKITFVPDYTAVIHDDCTYLEISADTYLLAYKSTLISRNSAHKEANGDANAHPDGHASIALNGTAHKEDESDGKPLEDVQL